MARRSLKNVLPPGYLPWATSHYLHVATLCAITLYRPSLIRVSLNRMLQSGYSAYNSVLTLWRTVIYAARLPISNVPLERRKTVGLRSVAVSIACEENSLHRSTKRWFRRFTMTLTLYGWCYHNLKLAIMLEYADCWIADRKWGLTAN